MARKTRTKPTSVQIMFLAFTDTVKGYNTLADNGGVLTYFIVSGRTRRIGNKYVHINSSNDEKIPLDRLTKVRYGSHPTGRQQSEYALNPKGYAAYRPVFEALLKNKPICSVNMDRLTIEKMDALHKSAWERYKEQTKYNLGWLKRKANQMAEQAKNLEEILNTL